MFGTNSAEGYRSWVPYSFSINNDLKKDQKLGDLLVRDGFVLVRRMCYPALECDVKSCVTARGKRAVILSSLPSEVLHQYTHFPHKNPRKGHEMMHCLLRPCVNASGDVFTYDFPDAFPLGGKH